MASQPRLNAQGKSIRVGMLWHAASEEEERMYLSEFRRGMADLGYVEGKNLILDNRFPAERPELFNKYAAELAALKPDVLVTISPLSATAAQHATRTLPVVFTIVPDPVRAKLVESLARPGGNMTGLSTLLVDLIPKRMQILKQMLPSLSRAALLFNPRDPKYARDQIDEFRAAAHALNFEVEAFEVTAPEKLDDAFSQIANGTFGAAVSVADSMFTIERFKIAKLALKAKLPFMGHNAEMVSAGSLLSYGPNFRAILYSAAYYVDKIVKGAKPAELPVEQPSKLELIINTKTAKALGISVPFHLQQMADDIVE